MRLARLCVDREQLPVNEYEITVRVQLPDTMDSTPLIVLSGIVLGALQEAEVTVTHVEARPSGNGD